MSIAAPTIVQTLIHLPADRMADWPSAIPPVGPGFTRATFSIHEPSPEPGYSGTIVIVDIEGLDPASAQNWVDQVIDDFQRQAEGRPPTSPVPAAETTTRPDGRTQTEYPDVPFGGVLPPGPPPGFRRRLDIVWERGRPSYRIRDVQDAVGVIPVG